MAKVSYRNSASTHERSIQLFYSFQGSSEGIGKRFKKMKDGYSLLIFHFNVGKAILLGNPHISHFSNLVEVKLDIKPTEKVHKIKEGKGFLRKMELTLLSHHPLASLL